MNRPFAVIFDMDGVLVDSYHAHARSWRVMAAERGLTMTAAQFDATFGRTSREIIAAIWPEGVRRSRGRRHGRPQGGRLPRARPPAISVPCPAWTACWPGCSRRAAMAVGSSGPPENVDRVLGLSGTRPLLASIVTGDGRDPGRARPAGLSPRRGQVGDPAATVCGNRRRPAGDQAAQPAGSAGVGLASTGRAASMLADADLVVESLGGLSPRILRGLVKPR